MATHRLLLPTCAALALLIALPAWPQSQIAPDKRAPLQPPQGENTCSPQKSCAELAPAMIVSAEGPSPLAENLRHLTDEIGGRVTGSAAADKAVGWGVEAFRHAGVDEVHTEKFTVATGWSEGNTTLTILTPAPFPVRLVSIGWSPPTPEGGLTADVVDAGDGDDAGFAKAGPAAKGAIVLIHKNLLITWEDLFNEYLHQPAVINRAIKAGAAAIFWTSTREGLLLYRHNDSNDGTLEKLPQAIIAREDALRMARFLAAGVKLRVRLDMPNRVLGPVPSENVVAEIRGRENPHEFVLLGAHLDSWDLGTGALDNGCNAAMVIDAARVIHASGTIPRRSIRFVLFTGEEQGMLGSWAYARAHRSELDNMDAAVIFDSGIGGITGYSLGGRKDIAAAVKEVLEPLKSFHADDVTFDADIGTDNWDFLIEGVPTLVANQDAANYMPNYHAASDTYDKVDITALKKETAIAAITVFGIADRPDRLGKRQSRAEIESLFKDTGLDKQMDLEYWTEGWKNGTRGRELSH
jgi:carboxypeptidase Q